MYYISEKLPNLPKDPIYIMKGIIMNRYEELKKLRMAEIDINYVNHYSQEELESKNLDIWEEKVKEYLKSKGYPVSYGNEYIRGLKRKMELDGLVVHQAFVSCNPEKVEFMIRSTEEECLYIDDNLTELKKEFLTELFDLIKEQLKAGGINPEYIDSEIDPLIKSMKEESAYIPKTILEELKKMFEKENILNVMPFLSKNLNLPTYEPVQALKVFMTKRFLRKRAKK